MMILQHVNDVSSLLRIHVRHSCFVQPTIFKENRGGQDNLLDLAHEGTVKN